MLSDILKWGVNRRLQNFDEQPNGIKYKKKYITQTIQNIENELEGNSDITMSKYFSLLLDFSSNFMDGQVSNPILQELPKSWQEKFYEAHFKISEQKDNADDILDQGMEDTISMQLSNKLKSIRSGLIVSKRQFDFVQNAFNYALMEYQVYLE